MKVVACIISRMKSVRLKKKALADLNGYTMTEQIIRRLKKSKYINEIVLCTSSNPEDQILVEKAQNKWGIKAYAGHEEDVLSRLIEVSQIYNADAVLRVTGDNPFTDAQYIDLMIERHKETHADYTRTNRLPLGVTAEVMSKEMIEKLYKIIPDPNQSEYMSFFSFNPDEFRCEVLYPSESEDRPFYSLTIDHPEDLDLARLIYSEIPSSDGIPPLNKVIEFLDNHSSYKEVAKDTPIKLPGDKTMTYENLITMLDDLANKAKKNNER